MPRKIIPKILIKVNLTVFFRLADTNIIFFSWRHTCIYHSLKYQGIRKFIFDILSPEDKCDVYFFPNWPNHINGKPLFHTLDNEWRCETNSSTEYTQTKYDWVRFFFICRSTLQGLGFHSALTSQWHFCEIDIYVDTKNGDNIYKIWTWMIIIFYDLLFVCPVILSLGIIKSKVWVTVGLH